MRQWLRSVLREPRVSGAPRRVWRDVAVVGAAEGAAVIEAILRPDLPYRWPTLVLAVLVLPALMWRRTHPLPVLIVCFGTMATLGVVDLWTSQGEPVGLGTMAVLLVSLYAVCRWASGRDVAVGVAVAVVTSIVCIVADYTGVSDAIGGMTVIGITVAVGLAVRFRGRARQREIEQVRLVEREQLARDLHDTVAHHVSAIAIRAQAGIAVAATRPEAALEALQLIGTEASRTLAEMRAMVGILRRDNLAELAPTPSLADVSRMSRHAAGSPSIEVSIADGVGTADGGVEPGPGTLTPAVETALFRIAQEAVTNAQRHAVNAVRIVVSVARAGAGDEVLLRVIDDGDPVDGRRLGEGYGVRGMAERVELLGGSCSAGPGRSRGWVVEAQLPCSGIPR